MEAMASSRSGRPAGPITGVQDRRYLSPASTGSAAITSRARKNSARVRDFRQLEPGHRDEPAKLAQLRLMATPLHALELAPRVHRREGLPTAFETVRADTEVDSLTSGTRCADADADDGRQGALE